MTCLLPQSPGFCLTGWRNTSGLATVICLIRSRSWEQGDVSENCLPQAEVWPLERRAFMLWEPQHPVSDQGTCRASCLREGNTYSILSQSGGHVELDINYSSGGKIWKLIWKWEKPMERLRKRRSAVPWWLCASLPRSVCGAAAVVGIPPLAVLP